MTSHQIARYLPVLLIVAVLIFRMSRSMKSRRIRPGQLWIRPAIVAVLVAFLFATTPTPFGPVALMVYVAGAVLGIGAGYLLSRHQHLAIDTRTGDLTGHTSPLGAALFLILYVARFALRAWLQGGLAPQRIAAHSAHLVLYTDAGLLFLLALFAAQAWEIRRRALPLIAEHAARQAEAPLSG